MVRPRYRTVARMGRCYKYDRRAIVSCEIQLTLRFLVNETRLSNRNAWCSYGFLSWYSACIHSLTWLFSVERRITYDAIIPAPDKTDTCPCTIADA